MSIAEVMSYQNAHGMYEKPAWARLERIDYCDQPLPTQHNGLVERLRAIIRKKM